MPQLHERVLHGFTGGGSEHDVVQSRFRLQDRIELRPCHLAELRPRLELPVLGFRLKDLDALTEELLDPHDVLGAHVLAS